MKKGRFLVVESKHFGIKAAVYSGALAASFFMNLAPRNPGSIKNRSDYHETKKPA
jgi:hypothetical protein